MKLIGETVFVNDEAIFNVLVNTGEASTFNTMNALDITNYVGPYADYTLYFPIDYLNDLTGKKITVRGIECDVIGHPDHLRPNQVFGHWVGSWDMVVRVKRTLATKSETIKIVVNVVSRDSIGQRTTKEILLYDGEGQARQDSANESDGSVGTISSETYFFIVDWFDALSDYQSQQLFVYYNDKKFNVVSVENIDESNKTASIKAVWNG